MNIFTILFGLKTTGNMSYPILLFRRFVELVILPEVNKEIISIKIFILKVHPIQSTDTHGVSIGGSLILFFFK